MTEPGEPDWRAVRALFERCVDEVAPKRAELLRGAEPAVRAEVEGLLAEHAANGSRLVPEHLHRAVLDAAAPNVVRVGEIIAGYRLVEALGRGGMGSVFLAEQEQPRRQVAIKLLDLTSAGADAERRFRLEAEVLGRLKHEGIAQIHSAGVHEGRTASGVRRLPYIVMEYVADARTIDAWRDERRRDQPEILEVFLQLCAAMQHAHERGVVHRDLKPHNVLVDHDGRVRIIDFGIARALGVQGDDALTRTGELLGTLRYMSPEQVRGDSLAVDTRTDVHALGVILFELLARQSPLDIAGRSLPEVGRILAETTPKLLRTCVPHADTDLELILATAMQKEPSRRYGTAGALAEDLRRYLARQPINARPPSVSYQLALFARRRRALVAGLAALVVVTLIGGVTIVLFAIRAHRAESTAVAEGAQKADVMRRVFDNAIATVLELPKKLIGIQGATELRKDVISDAFEQLRFVEQNAPLDDDMRISLARAYLDLSGVQGGSALGHVADQAGALESLDAAGRYARDVATARPDALEALWLRFDIELETASFLWRNDRSDPGYGAAWAATRAILGRLQQRLDAEHPQLLNATAAVRVQEGHVALADRDHERGAQCFAAAVALHRRAQRPDGDVRRERLRLATALRFEAIAHQMGGDLDAAKAAFGAAVEALAFAEEDPGDPLARQTYAMTRMNYGYALAAAGDAAAGEAHMRWACAEHERQLAADPTNAAVASTLATASQRLADHLAIQAGRQPDEATQRQLFAEAKTLALRGLELARPLRERSRDMVNVFVVAECERIAELCADALR